MNITYYKTKHSLFTILALTFLGILGIFLFYLAHADENRKTAPSTATVSYETASVDEILSDTLSVDASAEGAFRGMQTLIATVTSGSLKGTKLLVTNTVGPIYGQSLSVGDRFVAAVSTYADGTVLSSVYEYDRSFSLLLLILLFFLTAALIGGKTGLKSLVGLILTVAALLFVLLPLLLRGWPTLPATLLIAVWITCTVFFLLGGWEKKTLCAVLGTLTGIVFAVLFALAAQWLLRIDAYREEYAEALLQLRQTGESPLSIRHLLVAGVIISSLGALMDVCMGIASAIQEVASVGTGRSVKQLFRNAMNIGRDMVGTMTNTLILAIIGSDMLLIVYIASLHLPLRQFLSSPYLALETVSSLASAIGIILAIPVTALICALLYSKKAEN